MSFRLQALDPESRARAGTLVTRHGPVPTPVFMPVGTQATVKTLDPRDLTEVGASIVLANTYHLMLRPGAQAVHDLGGVHAFMGWDGAVLSDSGGSVLSLAAAQDPRRGVTFRSHLDGSTHELSPERAIEISPRSGSTS
jgi:queuine tRNA-ribosyltransferase